MSSTYIIIIVQHKRVWVVDGNAILMSNLWAGEWTPSAFAKQRSNEGTIRSTFNKKKIRISKIIPNHLSRCHSLLLWQIIVNQLSKRKEEEWTIKKSSCDNIYHIWASAFSLNIYRFGWVFVLCPIQVKSHMTHRTSLIIVFGHTIMILTSLLYMFFFSLRVLLVRFIITCLAVIITDGIARFYPHLRNPIK